MDLGEMLLQEKEMAGWNTNGMFVWQRCVGPAEAYQEGCDAVTVIRSSWTVERAP
jgi:hypothetical protein